MFFLKKSLFIYYLAGKETEKKIFCPLVHSPNYMQQPGMDQAKGKRPELNLDFLHWGKG